MPLSMSSTNISLLQHEGPRVQIICRTAHATRHTRATAQRCGPWGRPTLVRRSACDAGLKILSTLLQAPQRARMSTLRVFTRKYGRVRGAGRT